MTLRPKTIGGFHGRGLFITTLTTSAATFLAGLLFFDPLATPAPSPAVLPADLFIVEDGDRSVAHEIRLDQHIDAALSWLARHQFDDGSWGAQSFSTRCDGRFCDGRGSAEHDIGITALATLAFLESGMLDRANRPYRQVVTKALRWLGVHSLDPHSGRFGAAAGKYMYDQALATLTLARGYDVVADPVLPGQVRRGAEFLWSARNPGRVWRYDVRTGNNDTSITGWAVEALQASQNSNARFDASILTRDVLAWVEAVTDADGTVGYSRRGVGSAVQPGINDRYEQNETLSAVAIQLRLACGQDPRSDAVRDAVSRLMNDLPFWGDGATTVDFNYWFQGTTAIARVRDSYGRQWAKWSGHAARVLVTRQRKYDAGSACREGSWDPNDKWGHEGGRIYATALNTLTLLRVWKTIPTPAPEPIND